MTTLYHVSYIQQSPYSSGYARGDLSLEVEEAMSTVKQCNEFREHVKKILSDDLNCKPETIAITSITRLN